jgi:alpha-beta hydrolase superfamily lysophospholipase
MSSLSSAFRLMTSRAAEWSAAVHSGGQTAAEYAYLAAISSYPAAPAAPAATVTAQGHAIDQWWAGTDPAGQHAADIAVPTLIADGTADRMTVLAVSSAMKWPCTRESTRD